MAGKSFSVHVDIGGRLNASLGAAVRAADEKVGTLGRSIGVINARTHEAIRNLGTGLTNAGKKVQDVGRNVSTSISAPVGLLAFAGGKMAYDYEKAGNFLQALGDASDEERAKFEELANFLNKKYPQTLAEIINTGNEMVKGGFNFEQMLGGIDQTLATAVLGEMTPADVGNMMSRTINSFQMPMATYEQAMASSQQVSDRMTYAAVKTTASLYDMGEMFRYVGGAMSAGGQDIDKATAFAMAFAKNGTVASEAGVALRSAIVRLVKMPAKGLAALNRIGMDLGDYTKGSQPVTADRVLSGLEAGGIDGKGAKAQIKKLLADKSIARDTAKLGMAITKAIQDSLGSSSAIDASVIAENVNDSLIAAGTQIDVFQFFKDLQAKVESGVAGQGDIATILEGRHFARYQAIFQNDLDKLLAGVKDESGGYTMTRYGMVLKGIVGPTLALGAATEKLSVSFSKAVFPVMAVVFDKLADSIQDLADSNPKLIKFAAFAGLAAIALGPLILVAGTAMRVLGPLSFGLLTLGRVATIGLASRLVTVAGGVNALAVAATVGAASRLRSMAAGLVMLSAVGGRRAVMGAIGGSIASFGKAVLRFPVVALRSIGSAAMLLVANPIGLTITAIVVALTALGVWVSNNWEGLKSFFSGFAEGLAKGINPQFASTIEKIGNGFGTVYKWVSDLLGPVQATNAEWKSWGETVGGAVANAVNVVAATIERIIGLFTTAIEKAQSFASVLNGISGNGPLGSTKVGVAHAGSDPTRAIKAGDPAASLLGSGAARIDGARAGGGPVWGGGTFLVGENGPELFSPGRSGNITPNHDLGRLLSKAEGRAASSARPLAPTSAGNVSIHAPISIHVASGDPLEVQQAAERAFENIMRRAEGRQRGRLTD